ncbi:hypothetical protein BQ9231_00094 [Cedratvirus lausannensis]|uniref:Uncharacterized protein n=2 Tax=Pithoviruses TaxID=2023203 RepID=A0A285PXM4_9VIRU|nr:hypothetical protein Cbor_505 [Cedratvirus borely]WIL03423.1 hypothetical protein Cplu_507 [Cedratvirus plubellavi]SOB73977.1 hypothetical protein BQ9231_00094 [Cedratvirus lausannensis]SPN79825.1 Hypothetical protein ZAZAV_528 [Cedratvirus Zaza IHUMI]
MGRRRNQKKVVVYRPEARKIRDEDKEVIAKRAMASIEKIQALNPGQKPLSPEDVKKIIDLMQESGI